MKRFVRNSAFALAIAALAAAPAVAADAAAPGAASRAVTYPAHNELLQQGRFVDVRHLPPAPRHTSIKIRDELLLDEAEQDVAPSASPSSMTSLPVPTPANTEVTLDRSRPGFEGISEAQQSAVNGFALEPPDQGLCVGRTGSRTVVAESVNIAIRFFTPRGAALTPVIPINAFFGLPAGDFTSDPKCYFDPDTHRWFHTILGAHINSAGDVESTYTALAVSRTSNPLDGYYQYRISALDLGNANCPCFGDQPLIGADKHGFYVSTAEYTVSGGFVPGPLHFNGAQLYAISKRALVNGTANRVVHYRNLTTESGTVQPATSPAARYDRSDGGTEYLVSGRDTLLPDGRLRPGQVNELTTWALTHTARLNSAGAVPRLQSTDVRTQVYGQPVPMTQRPGAHPLGASMGEPLPRLEANDERVNQVVYADGRLYTGVNTIVNPGPRTGVAWFVLQPRTHEGRFTTRVHSQGYTAIAGANVAFPAIGVDKRGHGVMAMTLSGHRYHPSAAYQRIGAFGTHGAVRIARPGAMPEDGFSCYPPYGDGVCRWGDYSASVAGPDGRIWSATEFIGNGPRDEFANWSTFVWSNRP